VSHLDLRKGKLVMWWGFFVVLGLGGRVKVALACVTKKRESKEEGISLQSQAVGGKRILGVSGEKYVTCKTGTSRTGKDDALEQERGPTTSLNKGTRIQLGPPNKQGA